MKTLFLIFFFIILGVCQPKVSLGQIPVLLKNSNIYAKGNIISLPDSINLVDNISQIGKYENYTVLEKITTGKYKLYYWEVDQGGIVDPAISNSILMIKYRHNSINIRIGKHKKVYDLSLKNDNIGQIILL